MKIVFYRAQTLLPAPPEAVFAWHENPHNIRHVCPPWLRVLSLKANDMAKVGEEFALELAQCGFPMRWRGRWLTVQRPRLLIDGGVECPFPHWRHIHRFEATPDGPPDGCLMVDEVSCAVPPAVAWLPGSALILKAVLALLFAERHRLTRKIFSAAR